METHQPPPNDEWGIDMDEAIDVFNIDVGAEFGVSEVAESLSTGTWRTQLCGALQLADNNAQAYS